MALGSFAVTSALTTSAIKTFQFASAQFDPPGAAPDQNEWIEESLTSVGVDDQRFRVIHRQFQPFNLETVADASTYAGGVALAQSYRAARGALGSLLITLNSVNTRWREVKVLGVIPSLRRGQLVGDGATATSVVVVFATWQMVLTDATKPGIT